MRPAQATPSAPTGSAPRSSQISSTRPAATKDDATRAPPSTISRVMPFSGQRMQHAGRSSPGGGLVVTGTRITCAPAAPSFIAAGASDRFDVITHSGVSRAECTSRLAPGMRKRAVQHHPHRRARLHARQAAGQQRIVRQHRADPDQDGVALRAQQMHPRLRGLAGDRDRLAAGSGDLVVGRHRELQDHMRALVADAPEMPGMIARGLRGAQPDIDRDAGGAQPGMALPGHFRIGILDRRHHARNAGGDDRIGAGRRLAEMRARLQRHIERGAARGLAGARQRLGLGMGPAAGLGPAAADDDAVLDHDRADGGIGPGAALPAPAERQRQLP